MKTSPILISLLFLLFYYSGKSQISSIAPTIITTNDFRILENQELRDDYERSAINFGLGIDYIFTLKDKIGFKTGLRFLQIGYKTNDVDHFWPSEHDGAGGYDPDPLLPYSGTVKHKYKYIQVPINLRYILNLESSNFFLDGGINLNFSTKEYWLDEYEYTRINVAVNMGIGFESAIGDYTSFFAAPIARYHLSNTLKDSISENLYSFGFELGIIYQISKKETGI